MRPKTFPIKLIETAMGFGGSRHRAVSHAFLGHARHAIDQSDDALAGSRVQPGISFAALKKGKHEPRRVQVATGFVVFSTLLPVTQPGGSDNPRTRIKMSPETATSTPVCKMVVQRCLKQSERSVAGTAERRIH